MTRTKDYWLRGAHRAHQGMTTWCDTLTTRMRGREGETGAGFVEYAGLMILIAGIYALIDGLGLNGRISQAISNAVDDVIGG